jgi:co-chaperonin GroES (HSP10)
MALSIADIIEPMPGRLAVLVATKEEMIGGIYVPVEIARSVHDVRPTQGEVIAIGDELMEDPELCFGVGDVVVFGKYNGTEISYQPDRTKPKEKVIILSKRDILCRFKKPEEAENVKVKG